VVETTLADGTLSLRAIIWS